MTGLIVCLAILAAGCGMREEKMSTHPQDLKAFAERLISLNTYDKFELQHLSSGAHADSVQLQVRKLKDFEKPVTDADKERIVEAIYEEIGFRVPLELDVYALGETPAITGKLTALDNGRLLIVSTDTWIGQEPKMPDALWLGMAEDGVIMKDGKAIGMGDLRIGSEVKGWNAGLVLTSYPGQTTGLKVEVTGDGTSLSGDLSGTVDEIVIDAQNPDSGGFLVIGGQKYEWVNSVQVLVGDDRQLAALSDVQVGDSVLVWFAGYGGEGELMQKRVTQIAIQS